MLEPVTIVKLGEYVWRRVKPWRRLKVWRNKRRVAKGKAPLPLTEDDMALFPKNTMRKSGVGLVGLAPVLAVVLQMFGVGECTPEAVEAGCMSGGDIAAGLMGLVGAGLYWVGRNRAEKPEAPKE